MSLVIEAVDAFAHALSHYLNDSFPDTDDLSNVTDLYLSPWKLSEYVSLVPFPGEFYQRDPTTHSLVQTAAWYDIRNLQKLDDGT